MSAYSSRTSTVVPCAPDIGDRVMAGSFPLICHAWGCPALRDCKVISATEAMDASASPRNPNVATFSRSCRLAILDVACRVRARASCSGGMPQPVSVYTETKDFNFVLAAQKSLNDAYIADMAKYATPRETIRIMGAWGSIPAQLSKENHKFQYRIIKSGARAYEYEIPIQWMESAGIIHRCIRVREGKLPLTAYEEPDAFKVYMADTGLLCSKFGISPNLILTEESRLDGFKGALAENYVMQALVAQGIRPHYWAQQQNAELDFVYQDKRGNIIPVEVKSAEHVRSRSLGIFMKRYDCSYALRISAKNFGCENGIRSIPLYAVFCICP